MDILQSITAAGVKTSLAVQKKSPEILMGLGAVTFVGAIVTACTATVKAVDVVVEHKQKVDDIKEQGEELEYSEEVVNEAVAKEYIYTGLELAKLYAPTVILSVTSLGMMFGANKVLKERNAAIASSYAALSAAYDKYRKNVIEKYGEEEDYNLLHGIKETEVEEEYVDKKGNVKTKKTKVKTIDPESAALYSRVYTKKNAFWKGNDELDTYQFGLFEAQLTNKLRRKGFVSFNEALEACDFERCDYGMVVGWIYDKDNPTGDNVIKIDRRKERVRNEFGEVEDVWILDFNVDGNIYDIMQSRKAENMRAIAGANR